MKFCKRCKIEMDYFNSLQNGPYFICKKCNDVVIPSSDFGNDELDYISDRGNN